MDSVMTSHSRKKREKREKEYARNVVDRESSRITEESAASKKRKKRRHKKRAPRSERGRGGNRHHEADSRAEREERPPEPPPAEEEEESLSDKAESVRSEDQEPRYTENIKPAWLSAKLTLDDFNLKQQTFTITGCITVSWKWDKDCPQSLTAFGGHGSGESLMNMYENEKQQEIVKVANLIKSDLAPFCPIDATKVFYPPSVIKERHIDSPCLFYNKTTKIATTQFYLNAVLYERLELYLLPFEKHFLNVKVLWNSELYRILDFEKERKIPIKGKWWGSKSEKDLYFEPPLRVSLEEHLCTELDLLPCWFNGNGKGSLRFAQIRFRVQRRGNYFIYNALLPLMIIGLCNFSIFFIDYEDIGYRLAVSVFILLTFTAYHSSIENLLPKTSNTLIIQYYMASAYCLQLILMIGTSIISTGVFGEPDDTKMVDLLFAIFTAIFWIGISTTYLLMKYKCCRDIFDDDWSSRGRKKKEYVGFDNINERVYSPRGSKYSKEYVKL